MTLTKVGTTSQFSYMKVTATVGAVQTTTCVYDFDGGTCTGMDACVAGRTWSEFVQDGPLGEQYRLDVEAHDATSPAYPTASQTFNYAGENRLIINDLPPTAKIAGTYVVNEGASFSLSSAGSADPDSGDGYWH